MKNVYLPVFFYFGCQKMVILGHNDDEKGSHRQKNEFPAKKRRRERVSSPKMSVSRLKKPTREDLVAKNECFPAQKADENGSRRQKSEFPAKKSRRERVSSPKNSISLLKMVTRIRFVVKNWLSSPQIGDENRPRRQN